MKRHETGNRCEQRTADTDPSTPGQSGDTQAKTETPLSASVDSTAIHEGTRHAFGVNAADNGQRLDKFLCARIRTATRSAVREWIQTGRVRVLAATDLIAPEPVARPAPPASPLVSPTMPPPPPSPAPPPGAVATGGSRRLTAGQSVQIIVPEPEPDLSCMPEDIPLSIVWEDDDIAVINKPAGLVVHPGAGNPQHTLQNALLHWRPSLASLPRAGIVHRLDRDTSGLMLVALNTDAHEYLSQAFKDHAVQRQYLAIVCGVPIAGGTIDAPLARHTRKRTQFEVAETGKAAISHFRVLRRYSKFAVVRVRLETGRTHQVRVHMRHVGFPVLGDPVYGTRRSVSVVDASPVLAGLLKRCKRQMLLSWKLAFTHPVTDEEVALTAPTPADMRACLCGLARDGAPARISARPHGPGAR